MKKIIKRSLLALFAILLAMVVFLVPSTVQSSDQLKNVEDSISLASIVECAEIGRASCRERV